MNILSNRLAKAIENPTTRIVKASSTFHPSAASVETIDSRGFKKVTGACLRQQYYRITESKISNPSNPDYELAAMLGDKLHQLMDELLITHGFAMGLQRINAEYPIYDADTNISLRTDSLTWDHRNNECIGLEFKSVAEYKANQAMERPVEEHVMQVVIYLALYKKHIPVKMHKPVKWYIWYISRTENWSIKAKKHGSPLAACWDFYVTLDDEGCPIIHTPSSIERWPHLSIHKILERYARLKDFLAMKELPPRDYDLNYSEAKLYGMYLNKELTRKADIEKVEKWEKKGCKEGGLNIVLGDAECNFCSWKDHCWGLEGQLREVERFNLPELIDSSSSSKGPIVPHLDII